MIPFDSLADALLQELSSTLRAVDSTQVDALRQAILQARRVFVTGKGRSGLQMRAFAMRLMHLGLAVHVVDDVTTPAIAEGDLLLIGSGSGSTPSLVEYAARARAQKARVALITAAPASPIADHAAHVVHVLAPTPKLGAATDGPTPRSIQPMGTLFEQALGLLLDLLVVQLMDEMNINAAQMFARHANLE